jgi:glycosyltransferase involved in cell wall biosynthesis
MIIGIDVNALNREKYTGTERYLFELIKELKLIPLSKGNKVFLYASKEVERMGDLPENWEWRVLKWNLPAWTHIRLSFELLKNAPDVFFVPVHEIPLFTGGSRVITTVHDLAFKKYPETYSFLSRIRQLISLRRVLNRADGVIAISQQTKNDLQEVGLDEERVEVIQHGIDRKNFSGHREGRDYILFVGRLELKKGLDYLLEAFSQLADSGIKLKLVGKPGFGYEKLTEIIANKNLSERVEVVGFVDDNLLKKLYLGARFFVFPSRYEGFGMPILEAMSAGVPILCSDIEVLREIGKEAVLYAGVGDIVDWRSKLECMVNDEDLRIDLAKRGLLEVERFTWRMTAERTAKFLNW